MFSTWVQNHSSDKFGTNSQTFLDILRPYLDFPRAFPKNFRSYPRFRTSEIKFRRTFSKPRGKENKLRGKEFGEYRTKSLRYAISPCIKSILYERSLCCFEITL